MSENQTARATHTPGPWVMTYGLAEEGPLMREGGPEQVCWVEDWSEDRAVAMADACLIEAAPDLLEAARVALKELEWLREDSMSAGPENALRAAILKAEGRA